MQKIGVFVCWCGSNIAGTVDVAQVVEAVRRIPDVAYAIDYKYMCSEQGQELIRKAVADYKLDRLVVCSCSPRMHEATFRKCAEGVGINPYMVEIANIREQCSWVLKDKAEATAKAIKLAKAAIAKVRFNGALKPGESQVVKRALVIGGGIAGIQTALDIAEAGYKVDIVEKEPTIGGRMAQLDKTFPTLDCSACILTPKMVDAANHENITLYTYSEVESVSGFVGNFDVTIRKKARSVKSDMCSGCGICTEKCPSRKTPSEFDMGLKNRGAIYIPFAQAIPKVPVIDREGRYVKTLAEGDFLWFMLNNGIQDMRELEKYKISEITRRVRMKPVYVYSTIEDLILLSMDQNFVPVIDDREVFIGIVTRRDIMQYICSSCKKEQEKA